MPEANIAPNSEAAESPIFSVVVGVLNGAKTIEKLIDSVAQQTLPRRELVIMDGGSTDETLSILQRRSSDIAFWRSEPDRGLYDAWNKAIDHCRGDYICFLGCDDELIEPTCLERLAPHALRADPPELICSLNVMVDDHGNFIKIFGRPWSWDGLKRAQILAHGGLMHRADLFKRYGKFDVDYVIGGDYDFLLRLGPNPSTAFVEQLTVRLGCHGMSHRLWKTTLSEHWQLQARRLGLRIATRNITGNVVRLAYKTLRGRR